MKIEIYPLEKVVLDGTAICFGMERSLVETLIGQGQLIRKRYYYFNGEICDTEGGYSYQFLNISIGVYREIVPEEVAEMIKEANSFGTPMSIDEIEYESKRANYFATIGAGAVGYYQR